MLGKLELRTETVRVGPDEGIPLPTDHLGRNWLPGELGQLRLVVKQIELTRRARHEQVNDALHPGSKVRRTRSQRIGRSVLVSPHRPSHPARQQRGQRHLPDADTALLQEVTAGDVEVE